MGSSLRGISALVGPSGAGKSSILNRIRPDLHLRTGETIEATGKGRHTTVSSQLLDLGGGAYVADTPGLRSIALIDVDRYEIGGLFKEFQPLIGKCRFPDCLHIGEPGCVVQAGVDTGFIAPSRYESYRRLLEEAEEGPASDRD